MGSYDRSARAARHEPQEFLSWITFKKPKDDLIQLDCKHNLTSGSYGVGHAKLSHLNPQKAVSNVHPTTHQPQQHMIIKVTRRFLVNHDS